MSNQSELQLTEEFVASRRMLVKGVAGGGLAALFAVVGAGRILADENDTDDLDDADDSDDDDGNGDDDDDRGSGKGSNRGKGGKRRKGRKGRR